MHGQDRKCLGFLEGQDVYFDTSPLIYFLDRVEIFFDISLPFFQAIESNLFQPFSSDLCMAEMLVKPLRLKDNQRTTIIKNFFDSGYFRVLSHNKQVFELAAHIRATQQLKMVDALHAATAIHHGCQFFLTSDIEIARKLNGINVIDLNAFL
jgi:predicted nucleic acid-binding protein